MSTTERLILSNQYRILAILCPEEATYFDHARRIVESGYEEHYDELGDINPDPLSREASKEVLDIMTMFSCLKDAYDRLHDKSDIEEREIRFDGFDGNNEGELLSYADFFCNQEDRRFTDLVSKHVPNRHSPRIEMYRRMLEVFESLPERMHRPRELSKESVQKVVAARAWRPAPALR
jgi:hypothetical protein